MKGRLTPEETRARLEAMDARRAEVERRTEPLLALARSVHAGKATRAELVNAVVAAGSHASVADFYLQETDPNGDDTIGA